MLPYLTVEESEFFLGRNLTFAETLWFQYSARNSDACLYYHSTMSFFIFYTILPLPYVIMELMRSKNVEGFKIQPKVNNSLGEMMGCYKNVIFTYIVAIVPLQICSYPLIKMVGFRTTLPLPSISEILLQLFVYFVVEDYANYWIHRLLHCKWGYQKIHHIHHEYTAPMALAAPHAHWAEIMILGSASFLGPLICPGHMVTLWMWFIVRQMEAIETHSGYDFHWSPLKYVPFYGGAAFHDYHHFVGEKSHSNFASVFTYCDYIYRTNKGYQQYKKQVAKKKVCTEKEYFHWKDSEIAL